METAQINPELIEHRDYSELDVQPSFASGLQLFAVIVYLISQAFTIPILSIGPSWAVWPRLDDFATLFLALVYVRTRHLVCPMSKTERFVSTLIILGIIVSVPSTFMGKLIRPEFVKAPTFGIYQTFRVIEYFAVWYCIRGMTFSSKQFNKISYTVFFVVLFVVIIGFGNVTGAIPPARLVAHLPVEGAWAMVHKRTGAFRAMGPYGWNPGYMVDQLVFLTMIVLASRKPRAIFRILLVGAVGCVVFLSGSRAATIAWCVALAIWAHKSAKQLIIMLIVISLLIPFLYIFLGSPDSPVAELVGPRLHSIIYRKEDITMGGRTLQWVAVLRYITSHPSVPIMGVGWGFGSEALEPETGIFRAHSMYLDVLLEVGVFGAIMFYILLFDMYRLLRGKDRLLAAIRAAFLGLLVASITGAVFFPLPTGGSFLGFTGAVFAISTATYRGKLLEERYYEDYEWLEQEDSS